MKRAGRLQTLWIVTASVAILAWYSCIALFKSLLGKPQRAWIDHHTFIFSHRILNLVSAKTKIINPNNIKPIKGEPTIIMCNHSSLYDIPISFQVFPHQSLRMLAKNEMKSWPLMGRAMKVCEFPFVNRKNRQQAMHDLHLVRNLLESGIVIWIAPEGTRSKDGKLGQFKKGGFITAIQTKAKIIPIGIRGAERILPKKTYKIHLNETTEVHVGDPIDASDYDIHNKDELIAKVFASMKTLVGE